MEEMTSNVQQNVESANHANHISQNMREAVEECKSLLQTLLDQTMGFQLDYTTKGESQTVNTL